MRHFVTRWTILAPLALLIVLFTAATQRAADPPAASPQAEIANALKPGQPASQRLAAVVLIGELAAAAKWDASAAFSLNEYAQPLAKMAKDDPDAAVRRAALNALGKLRPNLSVVVPTLSAILHNPDPSRAAERIEAVKTISALISRDKPYDIVWANPVQTFVGEIVSAGNDRVTIKLGDHERTFAVNQDTWITYQDEKDTTNKRTDISLAQLNDKKNTTVRIAARGDGEPLRAVRVEAYTLRGQEFPWNNLEVFAWMGHDLIPLLGEALRERDPVIRLPATQALFQFALRARDLASGPDIVSHAKELATGRNLTQDRQDLQKALRPLLKAIRDQSQVLAELMTTGDRSAEGRSIRLLACQTAEELATLRELLPRDSDRELMPRPTEAPPPKEADSQEKEEPAFALAPAPADKPRVGPIGDLAPILRALEKIITDRNDPEIDARIAAVHALAMFGLDALPATPALVAALRDPNPFIRWTAARTLGEMEAARRQANLPSVRGAEGAVNGLIGLVYDPNPRVRVNLDPDAQIAAITALGSFDLGSSAKDAENVVHALGEVAAYDDFNARLAALGTLKLLWHQGVKARPSTEAMARALTVQYAGFPQVQVAAAELLGLYGPLAADSAPALRLALRDADPLVRKAAGEALLKVTKANPK